MPDPIPQGYISLFEAWNLYHEAWPGYALATYLCKPFERRELEAFFRLPGSFENSRLIFDGDLHEYLAFEPELRRTQGTTWENFHGRTPFVAEVNFREWLGRACQEEASRLARDFDPLREPTWTMPMAASWIRHRRPRQVLIRWNKFRASLEPGTLPYPTIYHFDDPELRELRRALESGELLATAVDQQSGSVVEIPVLEWPYLEWVYDSNLVERLDQKNRFGTLVPRYRDVRLRSSEILKLWLPSEATPTLEDVAEDIEGVQLRPGTMAAMKETIGKAQKYLQGKGFSKLTRDEAESLLVQLHRGSRDARRKAAGAKIPARDKRRPSGELGNRPNELEECRRFLYSAT